MPVNMNNTYNPSPMPFAPGIRPVDNFGLVGQGRQAALPGREDPLLGPAATVEISPQARAAYAASAVGQQGGEDGKAVDGRPNAGGVDGAKECETCKNRKYVDGSDDASVSFQSPTHISPGSAPAAVASHEGEHVAHEQANAAREGRKVVSQTVTIKTSVCPECGRVYVAGGETRTKTASKPEAPKPQEAQGGKAA